MKPNKKTTLCRQLNADRQPFDEFRRRAVAAAAKQPKTAGITLDLCEWLDDADEGIEIPGLKSGSDLESASKGMVRVILAPRDTPTPGAAALVELFDSCSIPSAFVDESLRDVSQSFAACEDADGTTWIWFHLLCKTLAVIDNKIAPGPGFVEAEGKEAKSRQAARAQSQANFSWIKTGIVLKIRKQSDDPPPPVRTSSSDSDKTLAPTPTKAAVELICFGAPSTLRDRIRALTKTTSCEVLLEDPHMLLELVFEEMYKLLDWTAWAVSDTFGPLETVRALLFRPSVMLMYCQQTLGIASRVGKATEELPKDLFTGLHNLAKHAIYLHENCEAALATLNDLYTHHTALMGTDPNTLQRQTKEALKYRQTLFESTQRRLTSLNARISNIIGLSFNIVTQGDSKLMQSENQSMKTIAVMTLWFMPLGTVASIFGSQFMKLQDEWPHHITVSQDFWLMWGM
ncbi:uncharacterized protein J4E84_008326 [Alternaria hordeiaustralica]|uniref:uncharacterized protein n=1 Tax=Alternaria hordeiaustralica TaxID=1187925 RepID=UPI0020C516E2|nr:uncharacterized protein J4E84_008326 [Alternaria hordeiaustralica]KAI4679298.1 hypothetical protein J4E84_008326 [Alternaria hordeiaustralica]